MFLENNKKIIGTTKLKELEILDNFFRFTLVKYNAIPWVKVVNDCLGFTVIVV